MRDKRTHALARVAILIFIFMASAICAFAQNSLVWPGYHNDAGRKGQNTASTDITSPSDLNLIFAFPRVSKPPVDEDSGVVDDMDGGTVFDWQGVWAEVRPPTDAWNDHALQATVISREKAKKINPGKASYARHKAAWLFPSTLPHGSYRVYVWVPSAPKDSKYQYTSQAEYTVWDDTGATTVKFDQRDGGQWKLLTERIFSFTNSNVPSNEWNGYCVALNDVTDDTDDDPYTDTVVDLKVAADAVRFVPSVGMEIYSSPVSATWDWEFEWDNSGTPVRETINAPFVYVGTLEPPFSPGAPETGTVYCVNSATPPIDHDPFKKDADDNYVYPDDEKWRQMADYVATPQWQYPRPAKQRMDPAFGLDIEGPIEGGIYSSPVLAVIDTNTDPGVTEETLVCFVTGMDRQTYAFDAKTGQLLWKGPGVTKSEPELAVASTKWFVENGGGNGRPDAFGGKFHYIPSDETGAPNAEWSFGAELASVTNAPGLSYAVYVWIPATWPTDHNVNSETLPRCRDARYKITYQTPTGGTIEETVIVDQSLDDNQGRWVQLGSSFWNVQKVVLETTTKDTARKSVLVADAVMIVPEHVSAFSYCSPVVKNDTRGGVEQNVFVVSAISGRAMSFMTSDWDRTNHIGKLDWIYPQVRTSNSETNATSMGEVAASPAYHDGLLYVAAYDGRIHCIDAVGKHSKKGQAMWVFDPGTDDVHFTSSPAIDDKGTNPPRLYIGSSGGVFYCIDARDDGGSAVWQYPAAGSMGFPLEGFRYSTAAIATDSRSKRRAWIAGSGGKIYSFHLDTADPAGRRLYVKYDENGNNPVVHGAQWYGEPSAGGPVQASVALDGGTTMYVGNMDGTLRWFNVLDGSTTWSGVKAKYKGWKTEGSLFSSPNITNLNFTELTGREKVSYVYVGGADGRIYAFSRPDGAWGGSWIDSIEWPFYEGEPDSNDNKVEEIGSDPDTQFDIFDNEFYSNCMKGDIYHNPEPSHASDLLFEDPQGAYAPVKWVPDDDPANDRDWIVSEDMKVVKGLTAPYTEDDINDKLREAAKGRRSNSHLFPSSSARTAGVGGSKEIYFEWGETINLVLWNLPKMDLLYGSNEKSKRSNIRFYFRNQSSGDSAGSSLTLSGLTKVMREYTVLDGNKPKTVTVDVGTPTERTLNTFEPLEYTQGSNTFTVKRSYAVAQIELKGTGSRPPSPGPGWVLTADVRMKTSTSATAATTQITIPLAKLKPGTPPSLVLIPSTQGGTADTIVEQPIGINNPLALKYGNNTDDNFGLRSVGPNGSTNRNDPSAHYNGNAVVSVEPGTGDLQYNNAPPPTLDLGRVRHGTTSQQLQMIVADRSAVGCTIVDASKRPIKTDSIQRFRIDSGDLRWPRSATEIRTMALPWEDGVGSSDYPDIYKRHQFYRKASDDMDPSRQSTTLPPVLPTNIIDSAADYDEALIRPDTVFTTVSVPRFQPALDQVNAGYSRTMQAYVDSDGDRQWDSGDTIVGRPSTYQEAYRRFRVGLKVPEDPRIEVEEQLIDIGRAPHGLGEFRNDFNAFNMNADVQPWFKSLTIKNSGNVNLTRMRIGHWVPLFSDSTNPTFPMPGVLITSSLDEIPPFNEAPFTTLHKGVDYGYTLSKPRVGDPDPTVLSIPDRRKWDMNFDDAQTVSLQAFQTFGLPDTSPLKPKVSVMVPLSQPIGSYQAPFVPVFADWTNPESDPKDAKYETGEPIADPSFQLKVTVRENQVTGGYSASTIPQIDRDQMVDYKLGDSTPAAFRDPNSGNVYLFWSSNRMTDPAFMPAWPSPTEPELTAFANAPWFIYRAQLAWDVTRGGWQPVMVDDAAHRWWNVPNQYMPQFQWPLDLLNAPENASVMPWDFPGQSTGLKSVRHHSPVIGENLEVAPDAGADRNWLAWVGTANIVAPDKRTLQEHRIFYTDVTGGNIDDGTIKSIEHDPDTAKRAPSMAVYGNRMWMFWQAGTKGNWSIFYSVNDNGPEHAVDKWSDDVQLRTPECLAAVSGPNAIQRVFWHNLDKNDTSKLRHLLDVVYAGTTKLTQNSDILLSRYAAVAPGDPDSSAAPGRRAQPLPRVFGQKLARDPQYGFYTGQHLAWMRMGRQDVEKARTMPVDLLFDYVGRQKHLALGDTLTAQSADAIYYNLPYVYIVLPKGYKLPDGSVHSDNEVVVSGTDGSVILLDDNGQAVGTLVDPQPIFPEIDDASGIYTYKYPDSQLLTRQILGEMIVDYSAGIVRITNPLPELRVVSSGKEKVLSPEAYADYTPQAWRLTTDSGVDNSPRAFIERTPMVKDDPGTIKSNDGPNPSMSNWSGKLAPEIDRLWVLWRKAGTGVDSSTIFFKTYRVGVDLAELGFDPIPMNQDGTIDPSAAVNISGCYGPWEVDRTGKKIYFTEVDERYRSLATSGSSSIAGASPGPITLEYQPRGGSSQTVALHDVYWIEELPEQSLFGYTAEGNVNEGSIYAFADPDPKSGTLQTLLSSKIWVFWTSTRAGTSDLFWETISPNFMSK